MLIASGTDERKRQKERKNVSGKQDTRQEDSKEEDKKKNQYTDPIHIVPTQAPLFKSEVHCSVILHIISQFALSDWNTEMVNRNVRDKIIASQIKRLRNVIEEGD